MLHSTNASAPLLSRPSHHVEPVLLVVDEAPAVSPLPVLLPGEDGLRVRAVLDGEGDAHRGRVVAHLHVHLEGEAAERRVAWC